MRLRFEDDLEHQKMAIEAAVQLFVGQEVCRAEFSVATSESLAGQVRMSFTEREKGFGNRLLLSNEDLLRNLRKVQLHARILQSQGLGSRDFTIEMETGTGKTYVYLRTIFELHKRYGFTKFIIVVPSVAIKEGTYKTLEITREHFEGIYPEASGYEYFLYDSNRLGNVRTFATSAGIQIMVVTVGAINKTGTNNMYKSDELTGGDPPIDLVRATTPIVIVDEPQSVDGGLGGKGKQALDAMRPLCTLRYSATHVDTHNMIYRLSAVGAYERALVKQIEVASLSIRGGGNRPYVRLQKTKSKHGSISAVIEIVSMGSGSLLSVEDGDSLESVTKLEIYKGHRIGRIRGGQNPSLVLETPEGEMTLRLGEESHGIARDTQVRLMINRTIRAHLEKEKQFHASGLPIKVLTLFFVDSVKHYRLLDEDGKPTKGKYARMFEAEYAQLVHSDEYRHLFGDGSLNMSADKVHGGYFSIDKKGGWREPDRKTNGEIADNAKNKDSAERAYNLIMQEKERLLSFDTSLRFIFSHSALREGWDNPNIFQICALREMGTMRERRQTIGRGLRLCVNQDGVRLHDPDINVLTVIATESYEQFARHLQSEIAEETGIKFGIVHKEHFAGILDSRTQGAPRAIGTAESEKIWQSLLSRGYIDQHGNARPKLRQALQSNSLVLDDNLGWCTRDVVEILRELIGDLTIRNADERVPVKIRKSVFESAEFESLWDRIKHKTVYRVKFDGDGLIQNAIKQIDDMAPITKEYAQFETARIQMDSGQTRAVRTSISNRTKIDQDDLDLPDILSILQERTQLTRRSIKDVLLGCGRLGDFQRNPEEFIRHCEGAINRSKQQILISGILYTRAGDEEYYHQELFTQHAHDSYVHNTEPATKSVYDRVVIDSSGIERQFARDLEAHECVKLFTKLPRWFKVPTPLGSYNPDWAILLVKNGREHLYLVVETKAANWRTALREMEKQKIECGEKHFEALATSDNPAKYLVASNINEVLDRS